MQIEIEYSTQVRTASGLSRQTLEVPANSTLVSALAQLRAMHPSLAPWIEASGQPRPGLLVFINDQSPVDFDHAPLKPDDTVALLTLVSGG